MLITSRCHNDTARNHQPQQPSHSTPAIPRHNPPLRIRISVRVIALSLDIYNYTSITPRCYEPCITLYRRPKIPARPSGIGVKWSVCCRILRSTTTTAFCYSLTEWPSVLRNKMFWLKIGNANLLTFNYYFPRYCHVYRESKTCHKILPISSLNIGRF